MRYDNWDVILFPRDSLVPIQEFRTACYASQDEQGRQLPTLTCYITSLPTSTPFRISIHSWATPAKPSTLIESRRKANQRVIYTAQVIIDGARVFHGFYELESKWPQEIVSEKRSITESQHQSSQRVPFLQFPPFHQQVLMQSSWDAREHGGRIKVLLSEQLIRKTDNPGELDLGVVNEVVCFVFQHAPRDILEQAGISWPIRNPLYLPSTIGARAPSASQIAMPYTKARDFAAEPRMQSPILQQSPSVFLRPCNPEPFARPKTDPPPPIAQFPKPPAGRKSLRSSLWDTSMASSFDNTLEDTSMDSWSTKRINSPSLADVSMSDMMYAPLSYSKRNDAWDNISIQYEQEGDRRPDGTQPQEKKSRQVMVTLRDDQLGQLIEAISPSKNGYGHDFVEQRTAPVGLPGQLMAQTWPSKAATATRPSAALARKEPCQDFNPHSRNVVNKPSPDKFQPSTSSNKENRPPSQSQDGRLPTPYPHANRVPTPNPFAPQAQMNRWDSDVSMRDASSVYSTLMRVPAMEKTCRNSPAPIPSADIKSKKEGYGTGSRAALSDTRHDESMHPSIDTPVFTQTDVKVPQNTPTEEASGKGFVPGHKSGMSSMDSTSRLERQLFSALGEELSSFNADLDQTEDISDAMIPGLEDFDTPVAKRKRQGTFGADRGKSPMAKMVREESGSQTEQQTEMPHLRGGEE